MVTIDGQDSILRHVSRMSELITVPSDSEYVHLMGPSKNLFLHLKTEAGTAFEKRCFNYT